MPQVEHGEFELGTDGPRAVVVGVDGTPASIRAGAYAAGLARRHGSRLSVVFARTAGGNPGWAMDASGAALAAHHGRLDAVEAELRDLVSRRQWEVDVRVVVRDGHPAKVIAAVAEEVRAEVVVVGCSRPSAFLLPGGPLPVQLMRRRRWPVVVVP